MAMTEAQRKIYQEIDEKFQDAKDYRQQYEDRWRDFYLMYRSYPEVKAYPWRSNIYVPMAYSTVETLAPRMFSNTAQVRFLPRGINNIENEATANVMNHLFTWQWYLANADYKNVLAGKQGLIYGTTIAKIFWRRDIRERTIRQKRKFLGIHEYIAEEKITIKEYDSWDYDVVDIFNFYPQPGAEDVETAEYVMQIEVQTLDQLKEMQQQGIYENVGDLKDLSGNVLPEDFPGDQVREDVIENVDPAHYQDREKERFSIIEYWTRDRVVTIVKDQNIVLRDKPNPFWHGKIPYVSWKFNPLPHEFYGIGAIEPIHDLQYELNDLRNLRMDNMIQVLNKMFFVSKSANVDLEQLVSRPGGYIELNNIEGIREFATGDVAASSYQEENMLKEDIQFTTGLSDQMRGAEGKSSHTATALNMLQEAANVRITMALKLWEIMFLRKMGEQAYQLNQQFIDDEVVFRATNLPGRPITKASVEEIQGVYDVMPVAGSTDPFNEQVKVQELTTLFNLTQNMPGVNSLKILEMLLKSMGVHDTEQILSAQAVEQMGQPPQPAAGPNNGGQVLGPNGQPAAPQMPVARGV